MSDAHEVAPDEDPEQHIGQEVPDPWATEPKPDIEIPVVPAEILQSWRDAEAAAADHRKSEADAESARRVAPWPGY